MPKHPIPTLLVISDADLRRSVTDALSAEGSLDVVMAVDDPVEAVQTALATLPQVVIVADCAGFPWSEVCNTIRLACPDCWILLLTPQDIDSKAIDAAMLVGVRQIISVSEGLSSLPETIGKLRALEHVRDTEDYMRDTDPNRFPRIISVSGAKGGVGKTTIAVNLAVMLASANAGKAVIWDAYSQFGDVANIMGLSPARILAELAELKPEDIDESLILSYILRHESGADVLITSNKPVPFDLLGMEVVAHVIRALRRQYRFIVVDTPPILDNISKTVFANCWRLLLITTLKDVVSLSDAMKLIEQLEPDYVRGDAIGLVANRVVRSDAVKEHEVESLTGKSLAAIIPEDPGVSQANNLGKPICQGAARTPAAKSILLLANDIVRSASTFDVQALCRSD